MCSKQQGVTAGTSSTDISWALDPPSPTKRMAAEGIRYFELHDLRFFFGDGEGGPHAWPQSFFDFDLSMSSSPLCR